MGLLLSVLIACVGVLEVIACVRHFQDGYLPLWTPHCAVTSGYTSSRERWRKKPSGSFEFRSSIDVSETVIHDDIQSINASSENVSNGIHNELIQRGSEEIVVDNEIPYSDSQKVIIDDRLSCIENEILSKCERNTNSEFKFEECGIVQEINNELFSKLEEEEDKINLNLNLNSIDRDNAIEHKTGVETLHFEYDNANSENSCSVILNKNETHIVDKNFESMVVHDDFVNNSQDFSKNETKKEDTLYKLIETDSEKEISVENVNSVLNTKSDFECVSENKNKNFVEISNVPESETETQISKETGPSKNQDVVGGSKEPLTIYDNDVTKISESETESLIENESNTSPFTNRQECDDVLGTDSNKEQNIRKDYIIEGEQSKADVQTDIETVDAGVAQFVEDTSNEASQIEHTFDRTLFCYSDKLHEIDVTTSGEEIQQTEPQRKSEKNLSEIHTRSEETLSLQDNYCGTQNEIVEYRNEPEISSPDSLFNKEINNVNIETDVGNVSISQSSSTEPKEETLQDNLEYRSQSVPSSPILNDESSSTNNAQGDKGTILTSQTSSMEIQEEASQDEVDSSEKIIEKSVTDVHKDLSDVISPARTSSPMTIDTSRISISPDSSYRSSMSPPKAPSTPRKTKADISWPTFFPGTPIIKRPSVSFATPEAVVTSEDQELVSQNDEPFSAPPCIKKFDDFSIACDSETAVTTSISDEKSTGSTELSDRSDSIEDEPVPITYKERSPSNIISGNDFSRKELKLQRRRSYKHRRYGSATEISSHDEQVEDRSFSEDRKGITRASSVKEPKKRYTKPAKSSSFEDALLRDITTEADENAPLEKSEDDFEISIPEDKETGAECIDEITNNEERKKGDDTQLNVFEEENTLRNEGESAIRPEQNFETNFGELKKEENVEEKETHEEQEEEEQEQDYSISEEQSSSQQKSPRKEAFWLIFSGEYTKAMSKDWHSGHFCCWQCDESLTGQRYVLRDDHPYCIKCYESVFANVCEECNKTIGIDSKDLSYKDKHWHEACFLCNKCRVSLVDKQFGSKADKIYCGNCYDAQFASRCDGCGEIFRAGTKKMEYKTRQWHEKCFCCCVCKTAIGTKSFIPREQEIYCATCYEEKFATRCVKCNKIITSGGVTYKNEPWHRECFTCTHCSTSLAGQRFTSRDEKPYCADCFGELFAKRCTACSKPITGIGGTRFISFEDRHWHNDCFICATCKTSLVGRGFITDADDIICPECAKQKLM